MKKLIAVCSLFLAVISFSSCGPSRGVVVERPAEPYYVRPVSPGPGYIWIGGGWRWGGGRYNYIPGYWSAPRPHRIYTPGIWMRNNRGYYYRGGRWH